jgi:hypothetical protein
LDKIKRGAEKATERRDPGQRDKQAGAREYEARHQERKASRLDAAGDAEGAAAARAAADDARKPPARVPRPKR